MKNPSIFLFGCITALVLTLASAARGQVRMTEVNLSTKNVEVTNFGSTAVDLSAWAFCYKLIYQGLSGAIAPGESRQFTVNFDATASDLGLYNSFDFGSFTAMEDFIQWGSGGNGREYVAADVLRPIWTAGTFLAIPASGLSYHARGLPEAGPRIGNWFTAQPHPGFPLPDIAIESISVSSGEWHIIAKSYFLPSAHRVDVNTTLSAPWQTLNAPVITDLGNSRIDFRFPAAETRQFVRLRAE